MMNRNPFGRREMAFCIQSEEQNTTEAGEIAGKYLRGSQVEWKGLWGGLRSCVVGAEAWNQGRAPLS